MRSALLCALIALGAAAAPPAATAQTTPAQPTKPATKAVPISERLPVRPHPSFARCCKEKVLDAHGQEVGDLVQWDTRYNDLPVQGIVAYHIKGGDAVAISVQPLYIAGLQGPGGGTTLFTTPDCSGNTMFAMLQTPPLMKRYAMVLPYGTLPYAWTATQAWLWVTDALPAPVSSLPPGTVFHSRWSDSQHCEPTSPPNYTPAGNFVGFWMHRVEDLYAKYTRPFYIDY